MPEDVKMNTELSIIEVRSYGDVSIRHLRSSREWVELIMKQTGFTRVLVDATELKTLPDAESLNEFGYSLPFSAKFAAVLPEGQEIAENVALILKALDKQGGIAKTFASKKQALAWLKT
jgi:hypothetical protein